MQLIARFTGRNDNLDEEFDNAEVTSIFINGNKLYMYDDDGNTVARAELYLDHNRPLWRLKRGQRGHEIGDYPQISLSV